MVGNLDIQQISEAQDDKEIAINAATLKQDLSGTDWFDADMTAGSVVVTLLEFQENILFRITNATVAARTLTVQASKRIFAVESDSANTQSVDLVLGSTTITLAPGDTGWYYTDGTANGLVAIAGGGGGGTWLSLTDTPASFSGQAGKISAVNSGETAMELIAAGSGVLPIHMGVLVTKSALQDIPSAATWTALTWDQEEYDTDAFHDNVTNNSRLTVPAGVTKIRLAGGAISNVSSSFTFGLRIVKNGSASAPSNGQWSTTGFSNGLQSIASPTIEVIAGDYFEMEAVVSTAGRDVVSGPETFFAMEVVETTETILVPEPVETFLNGVPAVSDLVYQKVANRRFSLADEFADSEAYAVTAPSGADTVFDVDRDGVKIGEITFANGSNTATFTTIAATEEVFEIGERLSIDSPSNLNSLADVSFNLKAWRS